MAAVDLGAGSGRVLLAGFDGRQLSLEEIHRFPNQPVMLRGHRFWNVLALWDEMLTNPLVNPIYGSLCGLASLEVFTGPHDILLPDYRKLKVKAEAEGVSIAYHK